MKKMTDKCGEVKILNLPIPTSQTNCNSVSCMAEWAHNRWSLLLVTVNSKTKQNTKEQDNYLRMNKTEGFWKGVKT